MTGWLLLSKLSEGSVSLAEYRPAACFPPNCLHFHWPCLVIHSPLRLIGGSAKSPNLCSCAIYIIQWFQAAFQVFWQNTVVKIYFFCAVFALIMIGTVQGWQEVKWERKRERGGGIMKCPRAGMPVTQWCTAHKAIAAGPDFIFDKYIVEFYFMGN